MQEGTKILKENACEITKGREEILSIIKGMLRKGEMSRI
jgi:hypothetical protein